MTQTPSPNTMQSFIYSPVCSDRAPSLTVYNDRVYAAWKGTGEDKLLYSSFDGITWAPHMKLYDGRGNVTPSLISFRGTLHAVVKGDGSDERIYWSTFDGTSWINWRGTDRYTACGMSLTIFGGAVFMVYNGMRRDDGIYYTKFDGSTWPNPSQVPGITGSSAEPSIAVWNDNSGTRLVLAWKGKDADETLWFSTFDGSTWSPQTRIPNAASSDGPALALFRGEIYAAWKGPGEDARIWFSRYDGSQWANPAPFPSSFASIRAPSLVVFRDQLYISFRGCEGDTRIFWHCISSVAQEAPATAQGPGHEVHKSIENYPIQPPFTQVTDPPVPTVPVPNAPSTSDRVESEPFATTPRITGVGKESGSEGDDYGIKEIQRGLKKGIAKGKGDLSEMFSKLKHK